jgi:hypothetical protein
MGTYGSAVAFTAAAKPGTISAEMAIARDVSCILKKDDEYQNRDVEERIALTNIENEHALYTKAKQTSDVSFAVTEVVRPRGMYPETAAGFV